MNFFEMTLDTEALATSWTLGEVVTPEGATEGAELLSGHVLSYPHGRRFVVAVAQAGDPKDVNLTAFMVPVVSARIGELIALCANRANRSAVQLIEAVVDGSDEPFALLNVLETIDAVDIARSKFTRWTSADHRADLAGSFRSFEKLVVDPRVVGSRRHIFRLAGWPLALIMSDVLVASIQDKARGSLGVTWAPV